MRITILSVVFVTALCLAGCKEQASQPANAKTENTINSTTIQSSDSELLKYIKDRDAKAAEEWKKVTGTDKLENRVRESKKW